MEKFYVVPEVEIVDVTVEQGFAGSEELEGVDPDGGEDL